MVQVGGILPTVPNPRQLTPLPSCRSSSTNILNSTPLPLPHRSEIDNIQSFRSTDAVPGLWTAAPSLSDSHAQLLSAQTAKSTRMQSELESTVENIEKRNRDAAEMERIVKVTTWVCLQLTNFALVRVVEAMKGLGRNWCCCSSGTSSKRNDQPSSEYISGRQQRRSSSTLAQRLPAERSCYRQKSGRC